MTGLHIVGDEAELKLHPYRPDSLLWRPRGGEWQVREGSMTLARDVEPRGERGVARTYHEAIYYQLVQVVRAIREHERGGASGG